MNEVSDYAPRPLLGLQTACLIDRAEHRSTGLDEYNGAIVEAKAMAFDVVAEWHRETHPGRFDCCTQQPCHAVARSSMINGLELLA